MRTSRSLTLSPLSLSTLILMLCAPAVAQPTSDKRLTPADVEKIAGVTGVKTVARMSQSGAGGDLNFASGDGKMLLMVNFGDDQLYRKAREQKEMTISGKTYPMELFAHAVSGLGDEAFAAPPGKDQYVLYVRRGSQAISVSTYYGSPGAGMKPRLTEAQLKEAAAVILSRW